jgi:hemolysin III
MNCETCDDIERDLDKQLIFDGKLPARDNNKDGRLFPGILLYCEGHEKPLFRGMSHLFSSILLLFGLVHLYTEANNNLVGQVVAVLYVSSNIFCYGCSALYHVGRWSARTEILIQKLDHCGIAILGWGTNLIVSFLLLPSFSGFLLATSSFIISAWTCWNIINLRPSIIRLVLNGVTLVPFLPQLYYLMDDFEFTCTLLVFLFQCLGLIVFTQRWPNPWPTVFGYHEIFHVFVIYAGACVYLANWGILRRTCNMYTPHTVKEDLIMAIHSFIYP